MGLQYHLPGEPNQHSVYEVNLQHFIAKKMDSDEITNYLFEAHEDYINPKIIARRQVYRLVDRVLSNVAPSLALGEKGSNSGFQTAKPPSTDKENENLSANQKATKTQVSQNANRQPLSYIPTGEKAKQGANLVLDDHKFDVAPDSERSGQDP